ncbi:MAG: xylose isomerase [Acidobacteria bacterium 13_2_20CM_2_57_6]|nr:MAG: xylose isomerase [Acidobacteria bacterium 13_2_20CM_57_7]OLB84680.1 MAG: xylose isomerase [Acidobacteria bacterium 13_2_20CM_2_57_6]PYT41148.1 MAG: xylose isomerase [Acidobacteriota bacterium]PYT48126.1 MAG: xylose isomerase [Acidobacteriota bacterium]
MPELSRREFLKNAATSAAAAGFLSAGALDLRANPLGIPIGCQTWPVKQMIARDFPGTIKQLADAGFQTIELCSPVGYAEFGFGGLAKYSGAELRKILADAGVTCVSSHFGIEELRKDQEARIAWAKDVGLTQMIVPSLGGPAKPTLDDVKRAAGEYNKMAELSAKAGIQQGLHNEDFELSTINGKRTYDVLLELLDPQLVKFQFQVSTISRGYDAAEYFTKYPGRFFSMHVQGWSSQTKKIMPVGQDTLDWKEIFIAAKTAGVKNYFVEMNLDMMKASVPYLRSLQV